MAGQHGGLSAPAVHCLRLILSAMPMARFLPGKSKRGAGPVRPAGAKR